MLNLTKLDLNLVVLLIILKQKHWSRSIKQRHLNETYIFKYVSTLIMPSCRLSEREQKYAVQFKNDFINN